MRVQLQFNEGVLDLDLDPAALADLHALVEAGALTPSVMYRYLRQVEFFQAEREQLMANNAGMTILIANEQVMLVDTLSVVLDGIQRLNRVQIGPFYIVELPKLDLGSLGVYPGLRGRQLIGTYAEYGGGGR